MDVRQIIKDWDKVECVRFAVWCARKVQHLNDDPRVEAAIAAAERWLEDPGEVNAARAASATYATADAAASAAVYAAYAAGGASTYAAAYSAASAANAAASADDITDLQLLSIYLSELLMNEVISEPRHPHTREV